MFWVNVFKHRFMQLIVNHICSDDGSGCPEALPPNEAVRPGLPPASTRLEASHTGGCLPRSGWDVLWMHLGDGPCIVVLDGG